MNRLQTLWFARQGLASERPMAAGEVARRFGWLRSVGSANLYLAIRARTGLGREAVEKAVAEVELIEVPAARGCTYYVAREDAGIALRIASLGNAEFRMAERHLGVTDSEIRDLADRISKALESGPLDPRALSPLVAPRHLGEEGKRRGMTSTLSLGLSRLQLEGRIRRLPQGGRLDTERFRYALWPDGPQVDAMTEVEAARSLADRYFRWIGPATEKEFRDFSGLSSKLAREAMVGLDSYADEPVRRVGAQDTALNDSSSEAQGRVVLLSSIDPWLHLRRDLPTLLDPADSERRVPYGDRLDGAGLLRDLDSHPIVRNGVVVGLWEFDPELGKVEAWAWRKDAAVEEAIESTSQWIAGELGDFRSFSLDSPASRKPRLDLLRSLGTRASRG